MKSCVSSKTMASNETLSNSNGTVNPPIIYPIISSTCIPCELQKPVCDLLDRGSNGLEIENVDLGANKSAKKETSAGDLVQVPVKATPTKHGKQRRHTVSKKICACITFPIAT